uniref:Glycosyl hydrolase family 13 catalytic domain-containing protein n=1 Tax=Panagrolaimus sp. JU765 TaxID=591449 RepID=A0AC34RMS1_9BILA
MAASEALVQTPTEETKVEFGDAQFNGEEGIKVSPNNANLMFLDSERLEHYRKDKKYQFLRWGLFIAFWAVWVALIVSAVLIIVVTPKSKKEDSKVNSNTYEIFLPSLMDHANGFQRLKEQIKPLSDMGFNSLLVSPVFKYDSNGAESTDVVDYVLEDSIGNKEDLKQLIAAVHAAKMKIIADVPLKLKPKMMSSKLAAFVNPKNGALNLGNPDARTYLLNGIANLVDIIGQSFDGVYIHEPQDSDVVPQNYNALLDEAKNLIKNEELVFSSDFAFIVAANRTSGEKIKAPIVFSRYNNVLASPTQIIRDLVKSSFPPIVGETTFTTVLSSADVPRFAKKHNDANFLKLINAIKLFAFPYSHTFYGEEYGQYCNDVASLCKYPNLDYKPLAHNATIPSFGEELKLSAQKIANLHSTLLSNSTIIVFFNSITRDSYDDHHYTLVYNDAKVQKEIAYEKVVPAHLIPNLETVGIDGIEHDYRGKVETFGPFEFKVLKFLKVD